MCCLVLLAEKTPKLNVKVLVGLCENIWIKKMETSVFSFSRLRLDWRASVATTARPEAPSPPSSPSEPSPTPSVEVLARTLFPHLIEGSSSSSSSSVPRAEPRVGLIGGGNEKPESPNNRESEDSGGGGDDAGSLFSHWSKLSFLNFLPRRGEVSESGTEDDGSQSREYEDEYEDEGGGGAGELLIKILPVFPNHPYPTKYSIPPGAFLPRSSSAFVRRQGNRRQQQVDISIFHYLSIQAFSAYTYSYVVH